MPFCFRILKGSTLHEKETFTYDLGGKQGDRVLIMIKSPIHSSRRGIWIIGLIAVGILIVTALSYFFRSEALR